MRILHRNRQPMVNIYSFYIRCHSTLYAKKRIRLLYKNYRRWSLLLFFFDSLFAVHVNWWSFLRNVWPSFTFDGRDLLLEVKLWLNHRTLKYNDDSTWPVLWSSDTASVGVKDDLKGCQLHLSTTPGRTL